MQQTISIIISGKVQGVFFRHSTKEKALELGITGQVSNLPDGSVQVIATGTTEQLEELRAWCKQGPQKAVVLQVSHRELPFQYFDSFVINRA